MSILPFRDVAVHDRRVVPTDRADIVALNGRRAYTCWGRGARDSCWGPPDGSYRHPGRRPPGTTVGVCRRPSGWRVDHDLLADLIAGSGRLRQAARAGLTRRRPPRTTPGAARGV